MLRRFVGWVELVGDLRTLGVTLAVPRATAQAMLPAGLELADQELTGRDVHPVVLYFSQLQNAWLRPFFLFPPPTNYFEHVIGVPYTRSKDRRCCGPNKGPFFYMPKLLLDSLLFTLGGRLVWGFDKDLAHFDEEHKTHTIGGTPRNKYTVRSRRTGEPLIELAWEPTPQGKFVSVPKAEFFKDQREIMRQPLISQQPFAAGPLFSCSDYDKDWETAEVQKIKTTTTIVKPYVTWLDAGEYSGPNGALGSFELKAKWTLSLPYGCGRERTKK
jgi:hypothetical protein